MRATRGDLAVRASPGTRVMHGQGTTAMARPDPTVFWKYRQQWGASGKTVVFGLLILYGAFIEEAFLGRTHIAETGDYQAKEYVPTI
ncbi:hypothetical protein RBB50_009402 [Rhinocladiella similis]